MKRLLVPAAALLLTSCTGAESADRLGAEPTPTCAAPPGTGDVLLQQAPRDVSGPFYAARTDGPCGLRVFFTGAPEGDGPCNVADYAGRLDRQPDGALELVVEARHTGDSSPGGNIACTSIGAARSMSVTSDVPVRGAQVVDPQGHPLHLVDEDLLLGFDDLPEGWSVSGEGDGVGERTWWSTGLRGPGGLFGSLRQGTPDVGKPAPAPGFGYREIGRPQVRGQEGVLAVFEAESNGNHVLVWTEGDRGYSLQVLGVLDDPSLLVRIADGAVIGG